MAGASSTFARTRTGDPRGTGARRLALSALACAAITAAGAIAAGPASAGPDSQRPNPPSAAEVNAATDTWEGGRSEVNAKRFPAPSAPSGVLPQNRFVTFYGAPQLGATVIGRKSANGASKKLRRQARRYRRRSAKPVIRGFDIIATIATRCSSRRDKCRVHQSRRVLDRYLREARQLGGRLILDIQPGRASVLAEMRHWREYLRRPDVDVAIDPEWNMGPREQPGEDQGSIRARELNRCSSWLQNFMAERSLPDKMMIVHQFRRGSIKRDANVKQRPGVDVVFNFDGIGSPRAKRAGYRRLHQPGIYDGFSLFYRLDRNLMSPAQVMNLSPTPDYVMYQ